MMPSFNNNHNKNKKYIVWTIVSTCLLVVGASILFLINNPNKFFESQNVIENSDEKEESIEKVPNEQFEDDTTNIEEEQDNENQATEIVDDNGYIEGQPEPTEPTYIDGVLVANKKYPLPKTFQPGEDVDARAAFELMAADARKAGFELVAFSTYRSYEY